MEALDDALTEAGVSNDDLRTLAESDLPLAPYAEQILRKRLEYQKTTGGRQAVV